MQYRVYEVKDFERVAGPTLLEARDDAVAIALAERFLQGNELQIWQRDRFVATVKPASSETQPAPETMQTTPA